MGPQNVKILGPWGPRILKFWGPGGPKMGGPYFHMTPAPAILDGYGHCVCLSVNKLGGFGGMLPHENF